MPKGPQGQKRPADVIGAAIMVAKIATGEVKETIRTKSAAQISGEKGGKARAAKLSAKKRKEIAKRASTSRWREKV